MLDTRTETINGTPIHATSWIDPRSENNPNFRLNEYRCEFRDLSTVYTTFMPIPVTEITRDTFIGMLTLLRTHSPADLSTMTGPWPHQLANICQCAGRAEHQTQHCRQCGNPFSNPNAKPD